MQKELAIRPAERGENEALPNLARERALWKQKLKHRSGTMNQMGRLSRREPDVSR